MNALSESVFRYSCILRIIMSRLLYSYHLHTQSNLHSLIIKWHVFIVSYTDPYWPSYWHLFNIYKINTYLATARPISGWAEMNLPDDVHQTESSCTSLLRAACCQFRKVMWNCSHCILCFLQCTWLYYYYIYYYNTQTEIKIQYCTATLWQKPTQIHKPGTILTNILRIPPERSPNLACQNVSLEATL